jgi:hypothetical protein
VIEYLLLTFSDLLSRHVNKAHKPPDENGNPPKGKKGRRKSMPTSAQPAIPEGNHEEGAVKARRASFHHGSHLTSSAHMGQFNQSPHLPTSNGQPQPPPLQAQSMYPHHPLLANTPQINRSRPGQWTSNPPIDLNHTMYAAPNPYGLGAMSVPVTQGMVHLAGQNGMNAFQPPFTAVPMRLSGSDQGMSSLMGRSSSSGSLNSMSYEFGFKKRACDQCNHSKVRCDFTEPCRQCFIGFLRGEANHQNAVLIAISSVPTTSPRNRAALRRCPLPDRRFRIPPLAQA